MKTKILCTLGPASLRPDVISGLDERGVDMFRINLSHTPLDRVAETIDLLQRHSSTPICLDTEGAQARCGEMCVDVVLNPRQTARLTALSVVGTADTFTLRPSSIFDDLQPGSLISIDFDGALLQVTGGDEHGATALVLEGGRVRSNRAATIQPPPRLPPFTEKDAMAIVCGLSRGVRHFALSFASSEDDVRQLRGWVSPTGYLISKIENRAGVRNMDAIIAASDAVLIDRGDLSREVPIEQVPMYQKHIVRCANTFNKPVFVATNLLESMVQSRRPTVAEANDIINTLLDGAHGLVLAAETAIGVYPVECVAMIRRLVQAFEESSARAIVDAVVPARLG